MLCGGQGEKTNGALTSSYNISLIIIYNLKNVLYIYMGHGDGMRNPSTPVPNHHSFNYLFIFSIGNLIIYYNILYTPLYWDSQYLNTSLGRI